MFGQSRRYIGVLCNSFGKLEAARPVYNLLTLLRDRSGGGLERERERKKNEQAGKLPYSGRVAGSFIWDPINDRGE